jgi:hypothetical protein
MRDGPDNATSRREFFRAAVRYGLLGLFTAGTAGAAARAKRLAGQKCVNRGICGGCGVFEGCALPAALSAKRVRAGG